MALANHTPATWTDILSTTMHNYHKTLTDNIFNTRPLLQYYMGSGRVKTLNGGISIVEPVMYAEGDADSYAEWDQVVVTPKNTATAAQYDWKQLYATIAISGLEEAQNNGREQIINLLEAKISQAEETLKRRLNGMCFGTYASSTAANDFLGLPTLVDATTPVGGIDPATEAWWAAGEATGGAVDAAGLEAKLRDLYNAASDAGPDTTDAIFTNAYGFGFYESTLTPQVRYTDKAKANLGFQNLMFKNVPIMWDFQCSGGTEGTVSTTSASFYGLNSKYIGLKIHADRNFKQSPFTENLSGSVASTASAGVGAASANALDARVSFITTFGNHVTRNRRRLWKLTGVTES
ncbi:MAG TPA: phage major capsid protein [Acidimicrobiales bacterium]|nr:phage major capsid protein [Acidimicrobiales bacterium]